MQKRGAEELAAAQQGAGETNSSTARAQRRFGPLRTAMSKLMDVKVAQGEMVEPSRVWTFEEYFGVAATPGREGGGGGGGGGGEGGGGSGGGGYRLAKDIRIEATAADLEGHDYNAPQNNQRV